MTTLRLSDARISSWPRTPAVREYPAPTRAESRTSEVAAPARLDDHERPDCAQPVYRSTEMRLQDVHFGYPGAMRPDVSVRAGEPPDVDPVVEAYTRDIDRT